jgi:hypothetical protein
MQRRAAAETIENVFVLIVVSCSLIQCEAALRADVIRDLADWVSWMKPLKPSRDVEI